MPEQGLRSHTGHRLGEWHGRAKWPSSVVAQARALRAEGLGYQRIGWALGVSMWTVRDWLTDRCRGMG
jgi:hypothetical protein